jgi:hypothetical protein
VIHHRAYATLHRELLIALESARTRLAVAIASETKSTPPDRLQDYLDTADRARRFTQKLRRLKFDGVQEHQEWKRALENLKSIPVQGEAIHLSQMLRDIVVRLE